MNSKHSALRQAIENGDLQLVKLALASGDNIEEADMHGHPGLPLRIACFKGNLDIVSCLIEHGANIHALNTDGDNGPIRMAARGKNEAVIHLLVSKGARLPADLAFTRFQEVSRDDDRRKAIDRRKNCIGPRLGLPERRQLEDRRATLVKEVMLDERLWTALFNDSQLRNALDDDQVGVETASLVFDRIRD